MITANDWPLLLPEFATHIADAAKRADELGVDEPKLQMSIEFARLDNASYREALFERAKVWRGGSDNSTIYMFSYCDLVPQNLISNLRNTAKTSLTNIGKARGFSKCNARGEGLCLYVGHSYKVERRLRDHLGFGAPKTSSLRLKYWNGHPHDEITFTAHRLSAPDKLLAQLLEEYLWDELKPLLGKRGGR